MCQAALNKAASIFVRCNTNISIERVETVSPLYLVEKQPMEIFMPLISMPSHKGGVIDTETNSQLIISSTPEIETLVVKFKSDSIVLRSAIYIRPKFPDRPLVDNDRTNPRVMISAGDMNGAFLSANMHDVERNTKIVGIIVHMIIFINKIWPLALSPYLWSDYHKLRAPLYRMPSDEVLLNAVLTK